MAEKRVTLVNPRSGTEVSVPESDKGEINQKKARGFVVQADPQPVPPRRAPEPTPEPDEQSGDDE